MNDEFVRSMTSVSYAAYTAATRASLSPEDAVMLLDSAEVRRFCDVLQEFAPCCALRELLVDGLCANDARRNRASIDRKVRGWLGGKYQPTAREDLLELCFVLRLDVDRADAFLTMAGEQGLHWRDPREMVYAFALRQGMDYNEAKLLYGRVTPERQAASADLEPDSFTPLVRREAAQCDTEEELKDYIARAYGSLGRMHNSAYRYFKAMLSVLEEPESHSGSDEERYSTRRIVEEYLDKRLPSARDGGKLGEKKRAILADWPDEFTLSRMRNRRMDVTRKVLILLFLSTDGGETAARADDAAYDEDELDEEAPEEAAPGGESPADVDFRSSLMRLNRMLTDCGYAKLDPRNPFDWIALYCMRVEDLSVSMDGLNERLSNVLEVLFSTNARAE